MTAVGEELLASASSGVGAGRAPDDRAAQQLPNNSGNTSMGESRKACKKGNQLEQDARRCARVQVPMGQETQAGQEQERLPSTTH